jgi:thermitase
MFPLRKFFLCLLLAAICFGAGAAETNLLVWHKATDRVDADVRGMALLPLLERVAEAADWKIYVEPGAEHNASAKFKELPSGDALKMLLGDLNFALVPKSNAPAQLYVFRTTIRNATQQVLAAKPGRVPNELLLRVKPGTDIDALAKLLGAKITGRLDKLGLYRLQFNDAAATDAALAQVQNNSDVLDSGYDYYLDQPPPMQAVMSGAAPQAPVNLQLKPPPDSGKVIVGLIDTAVQPLGDSLDKFMMTPISVADGTQANGTDLTHGTAMAETILRAAGLVEQGSSSIQILPVDVYGSGASATTWNVAVGITAAVNGGATVINLSLGSSGDSSVLDGVVEAAIGDGILIFGSAGNQPVATPVYPAACPGVVAVTALERGQIAPYADYGSFVDMAVPDSTIAYLGSQPWFTQGTSVSAANATGMAAGFADFSHQSWPQITAKLSTMFPVPKK